MVRNLDKIQFGHCNINQFAEFINERYNIYVNRFIKKQDKPWTNDEILQTYKFTNVFRQLDKGTIALQEMLKFKLIKSDKGTDYFDNKLNELTKQVYDSSELIFFNICWYRYFNWFEHAEELGFVYSYRQVEDYIKAAHRAGRKVFTGAWMTTGVFCEDKHITYLKACKEAWERRFEFVDFIKENQNLEIVCKKLTELYMVGKFLAYEIACDLRFTKLLENADDKYTWANMGPGAQRGLKRLGYPHKNQTEACKSMHEIYVELHDKNLLSSDILLNCKWSFELREVEHCLCEFDKYQRVKTGQGRPRSKYDGV